MAKIRNDYENSWWPRLLRWLDGGTEQLDNSMAQRPIINREWIFM